MKVKYQNPVLKKAKKGFRGYPLATVAYYGPDDKTASKVAVGIILEENGEAEHLERWIVEEGDVRYNQSIIKQIMNFIKEHGVRSVAVTDKIIGCPHEEGVDYPEDEACPQCPFWAHRDRWTGEIIH